MKPTSHKCRRCGLGELRIVPPVFPPYVVVHCQNRECDVTYEEELTRMAPRNASGRTPGRQRLRKR